MVAVTIPSTISGKNSCTITNNNSFSTGATGKCLIIINTAKNAFGIRVNYQKNTKLWMNNEILTAIYNCKRFKNKYKYFSKRKKKKLKHHLIELENKKNELCDNGKLIWINKLIQKHQNKGTNSWTEIGMPF